MTIFDASQRYLAEGTPTIVLAGKEYGSGSSRDWAAKGPNLLGVQGGDRRVVRADPPLEPADDGRPAAAVPGRRDAGDARAHGREAFSITGVENGEADEVTVRADDKEFRARVRLDTPREREYLRHGGILPYVLRRLLAGS